MSQRTTGGIRRLIVASAALWSVVLGAGAGPPDAEGYLGVVIGEEAREISSRVGGRLVAVRVRIGDRVTRGDLLAQLDDHAARRALALAEADLQGARAELRRAEADRTVAEHTFAMRDGSPGLFSRQDILVAREQAKAARAQADVATAEVREAELNLDQARQDLEATRLLSPVDGVVAARLKEPGALIEAGTAVVRVSGEGGRWVRFAAPPGEAAKLEPGSPVEIRFTDTELTARATVRRVAPEPDEASGLTFAEADLDPLLAGRAVPLGGVVRVRPLGR